MKLRPLCENTAVADRGRLGRHRKLGREYPFGAGVLDVSRFNADHAGIDLETADFVVLCAVIGGFHLMAEVSPPIDQTIAWFKAKAVPVLLPMRREEFDVQAQVHMELGIRRIAAGDVSEL